MVKYISARIGVLHLGHLVETGTTEEIFSNTVHPYTKSLISAIPSPNPRVEKMRDSIKYDVKEAGIDYSKGTLTNIGGTHMILGTDDELKSWLK